MMTAIGTFRTWQNVCSAVAIGGKADIRRTDQKRRDSSRADNALGFNFPITLLGRAYDAIE
jgi:hypothetical protein